MLWKVCLESLEAERGGAVPAAGRFVIHRHVDAQGPHLDLRLEAGACLLGWRIDGTEIAGERFATAKAPHPLHWLERDGDAVREDSGTYAWVEQYDAGGVLELRGECGRRWLRIEEHDTPGPATLAGIVRAIEEHGVEASQVGVLIQDGRLARQRALLRLCALGRELDGAAFDETRWKTLLGNASLDEIHHHLRAYEVRFDQKYPPQPTSQPEPLPEDAAGERRENAWSILQSA